MRVYEIAKKEGLTSRDVLMFLKVMKKAPKTPSSNVTDNDYEELVEFLNSYCRPCFAGDHSLMIEGECECCMENVDTSGCSWHEAELSDCTYGCKIYRCAEHNHLNLMHNRAYGCWQGI